MNEKQIRLKMGTITAMAAASSGNENSAGAPHRLVSELAPTNAGIDLISTRKPGQGSVTTRVRLIRGTNMVSKLVRRRDKQHPNPKPRKQAISTKFLK